MTRESLMSRPKSRAATVTIAACLLLAVLAAGCGSSSKLAGAASDQSGTLLARTFGGIQDSRSDTTFEFGDIAAERTLAGVPPSYGKVHPARRWATVLGIGASYFDEDPSGARDGLDILTGGVAITIGELPREGALIAGSLLDGARVRAALVKLGARSGIVSGRSGLVWGAEASQHLSALNSFGVGPALGEFDRALASAHEVIAGRFVDQVSTLEGGGSHTALQDPQLHATVACLGDVIAAAGVSQGGTEVAVGVRRPAAAAGAIREVVCVVPPSTDGSTVDRGPCSRLEPSAAPLPSGVSPHQFVAADSAETGETAGRAWLGCLLTDQKAQPAGWVFSWIYRPPDVSDVLGSS